MLNVTQYVGDDVNTPLEECLSRLNNIQQKFNQQLCKSIKTVAFTIFLEVHHLNIRLIIIIRTTSAKKTFILDDSGVNKKLIFFFLRD